MDKQINSIPGDNLSYVTREALKKLGKKYEALINQTKQPDKP